MRVADMVKLPIKAGVAAIHWTNETSIPRREGRLIILPLGKPEAEYFPLKNGQQFLFYPGGFDINHAKSSSRFNPRERWDNPDYAIFGGTDESAFMVMLRPEALLEFFGGGEEGLFEALKPPIIRLAERVWGGEKTRRQGDIFAYPLAIDWYEFFQRCHRGRSWDFPGSVRVRGLYSTADRQLFCTRHNFSGLIYEGKFFMQELAPLHYIEFWPNDVEQNIFKNPDDIEKNDEHWPKNDEQRIAIGQGLIQAEDHRLLALDKLHIIAQAQLLINPPGVD